MTEIVEKEYTIKPVIKAKFSGISSLSKTVTVFTGAQMDQSGTYKTGLTQKEEREFEEAMSLPKFTLDKKNSKFWAFLEFRLHNDKPTKFKVTSIMDDIKFRALCERSNVAKSELEIAKNPSTLFYVEDKEAKAKVVEAQANIEMEALEAFSGTTAEEKKGILKVLTGKDKYPLRGIDNLSETIIKAEVYKRLKDDPKGFLELTSDKDLSIRILVENLLELGKLTKKQNYYVYEGESLGSSIDGVIEFFKDPRKQSVKIAMSQEVKNKDKKSKED